MTCCESVQLELSEKEAVKVCIIPSQGMPVKLYCKGLTKGGGNVSDTGGTAVLSVIVRVPVGGGLLNSISPEMEKVFVRESHAEGVAVTAIMEQKMTISQLVTPEPPVC